MGRNSLPEEQRRLDFTFSLSKTTSDDLTKLSNEIRKAHGFSSHEMNRGRLIDEMTAALKARSKEIGVENFESVFQDAAKSLLG